MPIAEYLHGVEVIEVGSAKKPVRINKMGVAAFVGTAPLADAAAFPLNVPVLLTSQPTKASLLGATGTLGAAVQDYYAEGGGACVVVRVTEGGDVDATMTNIIGSLAAKTGLYALLSARALTGETPRTICCPGYTSQRPSSAANPVVTAALVVANRLRGRVYAATPSTSVTDALAWAQDFASSRLRAIYPAIKGWDPVTSAYVVRDGAAVAAGITARVHKENGFWFSPSNFVAQSIGGVSTPVDWAPGDADSEANILNEAGITTFINEGAAVGGNRGGWRIWGDRTLSDDPLWAFESVRTIADAVYEALDEAARWAVDKPATKQLLLDMTEMSNDFVRFGTDQGWLVGGKVWLDPEDNTPAQMQSGVYVWSIDLEPVAPMEHIAFKATRNADYYIEHLADVSAMIASQI